MLAHTKNALKNLAIATSLVALASTTHAEDINYNFAGFASIGYGKAINADPEKSTINPDKTFDDLNGFNAEGDYRSLNILGLRLDANMDDKLAFAAQAVMKGSREEYSPTFSWLYAVYNATPNLKVFIGKTAMPLYMYSDFLDAKYAYQWITPPEAIYGSKLLESNTGLQINWNIDITDNWYTSINAWAGRDEQFITSLGISLDLDEQAGISWSVQNDWFTLRAAYSSASTAFDDNVNELLYQKVNGAIQLASSGTAPAINKGDIIWDGNSGRSYYSGVGIGLNFERFYISAEAVYLEIPETNIAITNSTGGYIGAGFNITEAWSIHTTYNQSKDDYNEDIAKNYASANSSFAGIATFSGILNQLVRDEQEREMESIALGVRWNFHKAAALKLEYTKAKIKEGTSKERKPDTLAIAADFIF